MRLHDATTSTRASLGRATLMVFRAAHHRTARIPEEAEISGGLQGRPKSHGQCRYRLDGVFAAWPSPGPSSVLSAWSAELPSKHLPPHPIAVFGCVQHLLRLLPRAPTPCLGHRLKRREIDGARGSWLVCAPLRRLCVEDGAAVGWYARHVWLSPQLRAQQRSLLQQLETTEMKMSVRNPQLLPARRRPYWPSQSETACPRAVGRRRAP